MMRQLLPALFCLFTLSICAQEIKINNGLEGYWTGAFIRNGNSVQSLTVDFYIEDDTLRAAAAIPDWAYYPPRTSAVQQEGRVVKFDTYYGEVTLVQDSTYAEMTGECNFAQVHLKKGLRPPRRKLEQLDLTVDFGDIQSEATITKPAGPGPWPTAILVHGRGCGSKDRWGRRPEVLAQYGMAVATFDKRGYERTGFPCEETTMDMHSADLARLTEQVAKLPYVSSVGYISYSAGGWVAPKAAAETQAEVAFIASVVGPSTSVKQQQLDCCVYYVRDQLGLGETAIKEALAYTELEYEEGNPEETYGKLMALLDSAEVNGWKDVLAEDDIPSSPEALDDLWVRRNRYDPAEDLQAFKGPFLSILGGDDYVVPYRENSARFQELFDAVGKTNYRISIIPGAGHGMEHGHQVRDLGYEKSIRKWPTYFKFDRVAPGAVDEIVAFLREYGFID
ncbi:MAG: alpha/beta hydrolase [Phaeodactylibacter sp.]|nr:alpha/beta hydrolase [Phaeodactylibacter sp.]